MNPATAQVLVSAVIRGLDLIGRVAEKQFDSREELDAYIAERDQVRKELVEQAIELGGSDPAEPAEEEQAEPAGDDLAHGYVPAEVQSEGDARAAAEENRSGGEDFPSGATDATEANPQSD